MFARAGLGALLFLAGVACNKDDGMKLVLQKVVQVTEPPLFMMGFVPPIKEMLDPAYYRVNQVSDYTGVEKEVKEFRIHPQGVFSQRSVVVFVFSARKMQCPVSVPKGGIASDLSVNVVVKIEEQRCSALVKPSGHWKQLIHRTVRRYVGGLSSVRVDSASASEIIVLLANPQSIQRVAPSTLPTTASQACEDSGVEIPKNVPWKSPANGPLSDRKKVYSGPSIRLVLASVFKTSAAFLLGFREAPVDKVAYADLNEKASEFPVDDYIPVTGKSIVVKVRESPDKKWTVCLLSVAPFPPACGLPFSLDVKVTSAKELGCSVSVRPITRDGPQFLVMSPKVEVQVALHRLNSVRHAVAKVKEYVQGGCRRRRAE